MIKDKVIDCYIDAKPTNYNILFIQSQINNLRDIVVGGSGNGLQDEVMFLNIICSALKYYVTTSVEGFQESIMDIIVQLEQIFNIDGLLEVVLGDEED